MRSEHHNFCDQELRHLDSGYKTEHTEFRDKFGIEQTFDFSCVGCCIAYLTTDRSCTLLETNLSTVTFPDTHSQPIDHAQRTHCQVQIPTGDQRGRISAM